MSQRVESDTTLTSPEHGRRREALIEAAIRVVAGQGMRNLTNRSIAKEAGVAHGLIRHHFGSVEALVEAALMETIEHSVEFLQMNPGSGDVEDFVRNLVPGVQSMSEELIFQYQVMIDAQRDPRLQEHLALLHRRYRQVIHSALKDMNAPCDEGMVELVYSTLEGIVFHQLIHVDVVSIEAALTRLRSILVVSDPAKGTGASAAQAHRNEAVPELVFDSAEEFLFKQLLPTYVRNVDGDTAKWCIEWYYHPEAVARIEALWSSWEHLRLDAAVGASVWWRDHADHHMRALMDPQGPFYNCDMKAHREVPVLEPRRAPRGWFSNSAEFPHRSHLDEATPPVRSASTE